MAGNVRQKDSEIFRIAAEWHAKWQDIRAGSYSPSMLSNKFAELNTVARRLAHEARSHALNHEEIAAITRIELAILKDELHSQVIHQAC